MGSGLFAIYHPNPDVLDWVAPTPAAREPDPARLSHPISIICIVPFDSPCVRHTLPSHQPPTSRRDP
jgi:hypothetical protein